MDAPSVAKAIVSETEAARRAFSSAASSARLLARAPGEREHAEGRLGADRDEEENERHADGGVERDARDVGDADEEHSFVVGRRGVGDDGGGDGGGFGDGSGDVECGGGVDAAVSAEASRRGAGDALCGDGGDAEGEVEPRVPRHDGRGAVESEQKWAEGEEDARGDGSADERRRERHADPSGRLGPARRAHRRTHLGGDAVDQKVEDARAELRGGGHEAERGLHPRVPPAQKGDLDGERQGDHRVHHRRGKRDAKESERRDVVGRRHRDGKSARARARASV